MSLTKVPGRIRPTRIQSLARADAILDVVAENGQASLVQISAALNLQKNTTFYLLETLAELGYVSKDPRSKLYSLGVRTLYLGRAHESQKPFSQLVRPLLYRMAVMTHETISFALPRTYGGFVTDSVEGASDGSMVAASRPITYHASALGKVMLSNFQAPLRQQIYDAVPLGRITANTILSVDRLEAELRETVERGYSLDRAEVEDDVYCVASAVFDGLGSVAGAISVSGPKHRMVQRTLQDWGRYVRQEAQAITDRLSRDVPWAERHTPAI